MSNKIVQFEQIKQKNLENNFTFLDLNMKSKQVKTDKYNIDKLTDVLAVQNSFKNIFTWIPGERVLNPEFGSKLYYYLYQGLTDFNIEKIIAEINSYVVRWEPRVKIQKVINNTFIANKEDNTIILNIIYTIPEISDEKLYNYVYKYNKIN